MTQLLSKRETTKSIVFSLGTALVFSIVCYSCVSDSSRNTFKEVEVLSFPQELSLNGSDLGVRIVAKTLGIVDSILIVGIRTTEYEFCIYDPSNDEILKYFGRKGKGPNEFSVEANYFGQFTKDSSGHSIWIYDRNYKLLRQYLIDLTGRVMVNQVTKQFLLGGSEMAINRVFYYNDSCIVGTTFSSKGQFFVYNHLQDSVNYYNVHPQKGSIEKKKYRTSLFAGVAEINPSHSKVGQAYIYFNRIDVFDIKSQSFLSIVVPQDNGNTMTDDLEIDELRSNKLGYLDLFLSEKNIYVLKNHCSLSDISDGDYNSEIHVFSLGGDPKIKYYLDRSIDSFVVDEERMLLYGGHYYTEGTISVFKLDENIN